LVRVVVAGMRPVVTGYFFAGKDAPALFIILKSRSAAKRTISPENWSGNHGIFDKIA
jgi:hypothetical protein